MKLETLKPLFLFKNQKHNECMSDKFSKTKQAHLSKSDLLKKNEAHITCNELQLQNNQVQWTHLMG